MPLIGDENFLNMAVFDMKFKLEAGKRVRQSGGCVSGLRIFEATQKLYELQAAESFDKVIVNVGSVDIAEGRELIEMMQDMQEFLQACLQMQITPILTTLAPLPSQQFNQNGVLGSFNRYLQNCLSAFFPVIDLNKWMLHNDGSINFNLFQAGPRFVSGSRKSFTMWNKPGRIRVQSLLAQNLGNAIMFAHQLNNDCF